MEVNQISTRTLSDRYPEIWNELREIKPDPRNILSFGCSYRLECESLHKKYFKNIPQVGYDINKNVIKENIKMNKFNHIRYIDDLTAVSEQKFDIVFAMSVLCRWRSNNDSAYKFDMFEKTVSILDDFVEDNGYLCIYNSTYLFTDTAISKKYKPIVTNHTETGFVVKYNPLRSKIIKRYPYFLFQKQE